LNIHVAIDGLCTISLYTPRTGMYKLKRAFLGAFSEWRKTPTVSFIMSVRPSAWNNSAATGWIFMTFKIFGFLKDLPRKFKFL
jgi:hypothetical protein